MTTSIASGFRPDAASTDLSAATTPDITSGVVVSLTPARTFVPSMTTASVLVPPTSMPILIIPRSPASTYTCAPRPRARPQPGAYRLAPKDDSGRNDPGQARRPRDIVDCKGRTRADTSCERHNPRAGSSGS